jgi:hypothetical protein
VDADADFAADSSDAADRCRWCCLLLMLLPLQGRVPLVLLLPQLVWMSVAASGADASARSPDT